MKYSPTQRAIIERTAESILKDLDKFMLYAYNIYDVGRALPHPYNAVGEMGNKFLHDFSGFAGDVQTYIALIEEED